MAIRQEIHFESGVLKVDASGEFSLEEAKRGFLEMLEAVVQNQAGEGPLRWSEPEGRTCTHRAFLLWVFCSHRNYKSHDEVSNGPGSAIRICDS